MYDICACICVNAGVVWRSEGNLTCHSLASTLLLFETGSLFCCLPLCMPDCEFLEILLFLLPIYPQKHWIGDVCYGASFSIDEVLIINFTQSRITWEGSLNKALARSGWPLDMSVGDYLDDINWGEEACSLWVPPSLGGRDSGMDNRRRKCSEL